MRGEFVRGDGLVIPNNITNDGASYFVQLLFDSTITPDLAIGLCSAVYDPALTVPKIQEPVGNGYQRMLVQRFRANWIFPGLVNGEVYAESVAMTFTATSPYTCPVSRLFLTTGLASQLVLALSGAFPAAIQLLPTTPIALRTFKYRLYLR